MSRWMLGGQLLAAVVMVGALRAQLPDEEWLEDCRENYRGDRAVHCEIRHGGFRPSGTTVAVSGGQNGGVIVRGWDRDSVGVTARIQAHGRSDDDAAANARQIQIRADRDRIGATGPAIGGAASWSVTFVVFVPRQTSLDVTTRNGPVSVREVRGDMTLSAENGPITLRGVGGDVRARTANGPLTVELTGARWDGRGLDAESRNGPVTLSVPDGYSARLESGTVNGPMRIDFPVTLQGHIGRRISVDLGGGGATVRAVTTNGPVVIRRG